MRRDSLTWRGQHLRWLHSQNFVHPAQRLAYQEMLNAARAAVERIDRLDSMLPEMIPLVVDAFHAVCGVAFTTGGCLSR